MVIMSNNAKRVDNVFLPYFLKRKKTLMHYRHLLTISGIVALSFILSTAGLADQTFHSQRLDLARTDAGALNEHPVLRSGQVVDIHANGPQIGALERYLLNG